MALLSPAQCVGYLAFVLGVAAFLQRRDARLKSLVAAESFVYAAHFELLGNGSAATSALVSAVRSLLAIRSRSPWLAAGIVAVNLALGAAFARTPASWIPILGSCIGTVAVFTLQGIPMRLVLLASTFLWLANNVLSRSVGGTVLEACIATASLTTIARMAAERRAAPPLSLTLSPAGTAERDRPRS